MWISGPCGTSIFRSQAEIHSGIIGVDGSGKSTLLKILTGCIHPTSGRCFIRGHILSLLELGTGMNVQLTGRQNVVNSSVLLGFGPEYARDKIQAIEEFAELGDFFDRPIRVYSTGMLVRLAFSIFAAFDPDVFFIVDEALAVGDIFFQQKCARRIQQLKERGTTLLFVSHDLSAVEALCNQVLVLHRGRQEHFGDKLKGIRLYYSLSGATAKSSTSSGDGAFGSELRPEPQGRTNENPPGRGNSESAAAGNLEEETFTQFPWQKPDETDKIGDGQVEIDAVCFRRPDGQFLSGIEQGQDLGLFPSTAGAPRKTLGR